MKTSTAILRRHAPVTSFRAPNLVFPDAYLRLLADAGFTLDSSQARYKAAWWRRNQRAESPLQRIPASATSSVLRLPRPLRETSAPRARRAGRAGGALRAPVGVRRSPAYESATRLPLPPPAGASGVRAVLRFLTGRGARFVTMRELAAARPA